MTGPRFLPEALVEYEDAVVYYETKQTGLGTRVVQEFDEAVSLVMEFPEAAPRVHEAPKRYGLRWVLLRSFPLKVVVYTARSDELVVAAVFHTSRRPGYWTRRLKQLG